MYTNKQIWNVSYPIFLSLLAQNVINVTDTAFLGRVGEVELGASAMGGLYYGEFYQFNLSSCIRQQNSLTAQFVSFSLSNLANIFYPPPIFTIINLCLL